MKNKFLLCPRTVAVAVMALFLAACGGSSQNDAANAASKSSDSTPSSGSDTPSGSTPSPDSTPSSDSTPSQQALTLSSASYAIPVTGTPYDWSKQNVSSLAASGDNYYYRYGVPPEMVLREVPGGGYAIAWTDSSSSSIKVTKVDSTFANLSSDVFSVAPGVLAPHMYTRSDFDACKGPTVNGLTDTRCDNLAGFEVLGANSYYLSYSDYSNRWGAAASGANYATTGGQLVVKKNDGATVFQDAMTDPSSGVADLPLTTSGTLVSPLRMSTMRMVYDGRYIAYFLGLESYLSGNYHQGGFIRYIQDGGAPSLVASRTAGYASDGWLASHDFDQRIARIDRTKPGAGFVMAGLGDAYPRSVFAYDARTGTRINVLPIPGNTGENRTYTLLGGLAVQNGNTVALGFSSKYVSNTASDNSANELNVAVALVSLSDFPAIAKLQGSNSGDVSKIKYVHLTKLNTGTLAVDPKLAALGNDKFLVAWREVGSSATNTANAVAKYAVIDVNGNVLIPPTVMPTGFQFHRSDDFITASDGNVYWAVGGGIDKLVVNALKLPQ
ncbi:hypothetical protein FAZ69_25485 [Trinickia terrae]|uniref:Uncharacterized protein n=1 Tax=Trinickia terrae TaxID=2571161 RepID=A0A4U1HP34_9BURK|nr:hypothetical protein [Trinickia terrae]TKC83051.1 hypothetical protein FAZ69_25485 [Trinickia terrae]